MKYADDPLVMVGALAFVTVMVTASVAVLPEALVAEKETEYVPAVPLAAAPEIVAVPFEALLNTRPLGSVPLSVTVGAG